MPFLALNGIPVPVLLGNTSAEAQLIQDSERAENSALITNRRAEKGKWTITLVPQAPARAFAYRRLLHGDGHYWSFDSHLYSSKGLGPSAATDAAQGAGATYLGAGKLGLDAGTGTVTFPALVPGSTDGWTVMLARNYGPGYEHWIVTSAGEAFKSAAPVAVPAWLTVNASAGTVKLDAEASNSTLVDELVVLPFPVPSTVPIPWPDYMFDFNDAGKQWSNLKTLKLTGTVLPEGGTKLVQGMVKSEKLMLATPRGSTRQVLRGLEAELEEV